MDERRWLLLAAIAGGLAVALGAFGAHGLEAQVRAGKLPEARLATFETAVRYQMYHALALGAVAGAVARKRSTPAQLAGAFFLLGIGLFSGMLYLYVLSGEKMFAMVVPLGGVSFIVGWGCLAVAAAGLGPRGE